MSRPTHTEYAVQGCLPECCEVPTWWIITDWYTTPTDANNAWERFILRNKNEGYNLVFLKRMIRRTVEEYEVLADVETDRLLSEEAKGGGHGQA